MHEQSTTAVIQRYLDALPGDPAAEPIVRELLDQAVNRLRLLCAALLHRSYPRLTQPPLNVETDELLGGVVAGLLTAMRTVRPQTVRQFFALATRHMRWQLNDLARLLDERPAVAALAESGVVAPPSSGDSCLTPGGRRILGAIEGLPEVEREVFELVRIQGLTYAGAPFGRRPQPAGSKPASPAAPTRPSHARRSKSSNAVCRRRSSESCVIFYSFRELARSPCAAARGRETLRISEHPQTVVDAQPESA